MPKFDASSVSDVEYDFSGWKGIKGSPFEGRTINESGVVPEPSAHLVGQTMSRISEAFAKMDVGGDKKTDEDGERPGMSADEIQEALGKISDSEQFSLMADELYDALGELTDGSPSREALASLGWRKFMAFLGYVMGELMSPEAVNADSQSTQAKRLRSV